MRLPEPVAVSGVILNSATITVTSMSGRNDARTSPIGNQRPVAYSLNKRKEVEKRLRMESALWAASELCHFRAPGVTAPPYTPMSAM